MFIDINYVSFFMIYKMDNLYQILTANDLKTKLR